jgi:hypothetical protein
MVTQYPYILKIKVLTGGGQDANGYPIPSSSVDLEYKCRYRPNTQARQINTVDGQNVVYRGTVYLPKGVYNIKTGDVITVVGFVDNVEVLQTHNAQLRTRIIC